LPSAPARGEPAPRSSSRPTAQTLRKSSNDSNAYNMSIRSSTKFRSEHGPLTNEEMAYAYKTTGDIAFLLP
jgi:hypothetical protein